MSDEEKPAKRPDALIEQRGHTLILTLNRPEARNALSTEMLSIMVEAWDRVDNDPEIRSCILTVLVVALAHARGASRSGKVVVWMTWSSMFTSCTVTLMARCLADCVSRATVACLTAVAMAALTLRCLVVRDMTYCFAPVYLFMMSFPITSFVVRASP